MKFTILTPLSLLFWCRLSFPTVSLKIFSCPTFAFKSPNWIFIWYLEKWLKICSNSSHKLSFESSLWSSLGTCTFKQRYYTTDLSKLYMTHPITNKPYGLNCWYSSMVYRKSCSQLMIFVSFFHRKKYPLLLLCPLLSHLTYCTPSKSNLYLANSLDAVFGEPDHLIFHSPASSKH